MRIDNSYLESKISRNISPDSFRTQSGFSPVRQDLSGKFGRPVHTIYTRNDMGQKCEGNCGLWVSNVIIKNTFREDLKKIVGVLKELPAK